MLVDGTGEEDFNHLQQEIFHPIMQILGIPLLCAQEVHQSWQTDSQGKGSIIQTIFQSKIKKSKQSLGKEYRRNLIDKLPKQHVPASSTVTIQPIACSTPQKDSIVVTDDKSPQVLPASPLLELKGSNHEHTQPFDYDAWTKAKSPK